PGYHTKPFREHEGVHQFEIGAAFLEILIGRRARRLGGPRSEPPDCSNRRGGERIVSSRTPDRHATGEYRVSIGRIHAPKRKKLRQEKRAWGARDPRLANLMIRVICA